MTSIQSLKREVTELNKKTADILTSKKHFIYFSYGSSDEAHGAYGYRGYYLGDSKVYACPTELELEDLKRRYGKEDNDRPLTYEEQRVKRQVGELYFKKRYPTLESFLESCRCKCGKHGLDNLQPYGDVYKRLGNE